MIATVNVSVARTKVAGRRSYLEEKGSPGLYTATYTLHKTVNGPNKDREKMGDPVG